ncbi:SRPBCC family protein [Saccharomonospora xinjiangensis]|uniref:Polyketide cyclase / dehydrase family protein n=1 Tax=Saccharomonospora xinjiangensis XJ-54 TaxID=882086 RepID=I0V6P8_9PSEU|nr:SRPBCC family protein [Saccharomonospora xinjiangensis]EID55801.1 polyketide cyclase / dehydrase family protein [Saccharomonospora xinjiangensis XJ-54]
MLTCYRFRTVWWLPADHHTVFSVLADVAGYPRWWPDVRSVSHRDRDTAGVVARSSLPFTLVLHVHRVEEDAERGVLRATVGGDLRGFLEAVVSQDGRGTRVDVVQEVEVRRRLLRVLSPWLRPLLRLNHAAMMRRGRWGLGRHLRDRASESRR